MGLDRAKQMLWCWGGDHVSCERYSHSRDQNTRLVDTNGEYKGRSPNRKTRKGEEMKCDASGGDEKKKKKVLRKVESGPGVDGL